MKEVIISSTFLILLILLLRFLLRGKLSLRVQYALWVVVLVRLLVPVTFFETSYSVVHVVSKLIENGSNTTAPPFTEKNQQGSLTQVNPFYHTKPDATTVHAPQTNSSSPNYSTNKTPKEPFFHQDLFVSPIPMIIWLTGMIVSGGCILVSNLNFYLRLRRARKRCNIPESKLPVYVIDNLPSPCLHGVLRPSIYLTPEVLADETKFLFTITHEQTHVAHWDHLWSFLKMICLVIYWFHPFVWYGAMVSRRDCELACDEGTIQRLGEDRRMEYGRTLIEMMKVQRRPSDFLSLATTMNSGKKSIKERIFFIGKKPNPMFPIFLMVILIIIAGAGCAFTGNKKEAKNDISTVPTVSVTKHPLSPTLPPSKSVTTPPKNNTIKVSSPIPIMKANTGKTLDDLSSFQLLKDSFVDYQFKTTALDQDKNGYDDYYESIGNYDLNRDGIKDDIHIVSEFGYDNPSYLEVNYQKIWYRNDTPINGEIHLIDLDQNDDYTELAIFDGGPSGDECYHLFRYDGSELSLLGTIDAAALSDQQGKLISSFQYTRYFTPRFCSAWYEIKKNTLELYQNNTKNYLGKYFDFSGTQAYFVPCEYENRGNFTEFEVDLKAYPPSKLKLIDILYNPYGIDFKDKPLVYYQYRVLNYYYVALPSGEKGVLYFFIGD